MRERVASSGKGRGPREQDRILEFFDFDMEADHMGKACDVVSALLVLP